MLKTHHTAPFQDKDPQHTRNYREWSINWAEKEQQSKEKKKIQRKMKESIIQEIREYKPTYFKHYMTTKEELC